jgi:peroxidase
MSPEAVEGVLRGAHHVGPAYRSSFGGGSLPLVVVTLLTLLSPTLATPHSMRAASAAALVVLATAPAALASYTIDGLNVHPGEGGLRNAVGSVFLPALTFYPNDGTGANVTDALLPNPRNVSNTLLSHGPFRFNSLEVAALTAAWGQFLAHDLIMTSATKHAAPASLDENATVVVAIPRCDPAMDVFCSGTQTLVLKRNAYDPSTGTSPSNPRRMVNSQTGWLDGSVIYGPSAARAADLRSFVGGALIEDPVNGVPSACLRTVAVPMAHPNHGDPCAVRMAGDMRANVAPGIFALHGLFVLEHNRIARDLATKNPAWTDETLFTEARRRVIALVQAVTYNEYLIELLDGPLPPYTAYNASADARIDPSFAIAAYRYGHSGINSLYLCVTTTGEICRRGNILLRDVYFQPGLYLDGPDGVTIGDILRGLVVAPESAIDMSLVDDVRNFLEGVRADLAVADLVRGRDFGLPSFCTARALFNVKLPCANFSDITTDPAVAATLSSLYGGNVSRVEQWVGGLAESASSGTFIGPTFRAIIRDQFLRLRDGDPFFYENPAATVVVAGQVVPAFSPAERTAIMGTRLRDIVARNTDWKSPPMALFSTTTQSAISAAAAAGGGGGGGGGGAPVTPSTPTAPGVVSDGIRRVTINSLLSLEWRPPAAGVTDITLTFKFAGAPGSSWVGMGLGPSMAGADIWMMRATGPTAGVVTDAMSPNYNMPATDAAQDVTLVSVSTASGVTSFTVRRALATGDASDKPIGSGNTPVVFAWSTSSGSFGYHGPDRAAGSIDFLRAATTTGNGTGPAESDGLGGLDGSALDAALAARISTYGFHGMTMFFVWGFLVPGAVLVLYFFRHKPAAHALHKWANLVATSLTLPAAGTALVGLSSGTVRSVAHAFLGLSISSLIIAQIVMGAAVRGWMRGDKQPPAYWFKMKRVHKWMGYSMVTGAAINCVLGAELLLGVIAQWIVIAYFVLLIVIVLVLSWREEVYRDRVANPSVTKLDEDTARRFSMSHSASSLTMAEVRAHVRAGSKWIIVSGFVYDIATFVKHHPGGAYLIERHLGSDVTQFFRGQDRFDESVPAHAHSPRAADILRALCVGALRHGGGLRSWADAPALPDESCTDSWRLVAKTILPGDARRPVVKLEFTNPAAEASRALTWTPSSFGRYMVVRIPKPSLDAFLRGEDAATMEGHDPLALILHNSGHNASEAMSATGPAGSKALTMARLMGGGGNVRGSAPVYPYSGGGGGASGGQQLSTLGRSIRRLSLSRGGDGGGSGRRRERDEVVGNFQPGTITGGVDEEYAHWSRQSSGTASRQYPAGPSSSSRGARNSGNDDDPDDRENTGSGSHFGSTPRGGPPQRSQSQSRSRSRPPMSRRGSFGPGNMVVPGAETYGESGDRRRRDDGYYRGGDDDDDVDGNGLTHRRSGGNGGPGGRGRSGGGGLAFAGSQRMEWREEENFRGGVVGGSYASPQSRLPPGALAVHLSPAANSSALMGGVNAVATGAVVERPYTIVRADGKPGLIMYVRRYPEGSVSRWVAGLPLGTEVAMTGPKGLGLHLDDSQGGVIVGIFQGTCAVAAFDLVQHIAAVAAETRRQVGLRKARAPTWSREQWEASATHRGGGDDAANPAVAAASATGGTASRARGRSSSPDPFQGRRVMSERGPDGVRSLSPPASRAPHTGVDPRGVHGSSSSSSAPTPRGGEGADGASVADTPPPPSSTSTATADRTRPVSEPTSAAASAALFPGDDGVGGGGSGARRGRPVVLPQTSTSNTIRVGGVTTTVAGSRGRLGGPSADRATDTSSEPDEETAGRLPRIHSRVPARRYDATESEIEVDEATAADSAASSDEDGRERRREERERVGGAGSPPRFKLVLLVVMEHEDAIIEREWLQFMDATCDDFELHINLSRVRSKRAVAEMALPRLTVGRLTPERLERLLPPRNLLAVSLCGTPRFQKDVRDIYGIIGLPKSLLMVVG